MLRMFCFSVAAARKAASPPRAAPREPQDPPPIGHSALSPLMISISAKATPNSSATTCWIPVSMPWP